MSMRKVYRLIDRSLILATEIDFTKNTVTVSNPLSVTQMMNPKTGQAEMVLIPLDMIFSEAIEGENHVTFKTDHIMYVKSMASFPAYEQNYIAHTTGIEPVKRSGIIS